MIESLDNHAALGEMTVDEEPDEGRINIEYIHLAGQIPLIPTSKEMHMASSCSLEHNFREQATLSLQHLWRVAQERNVDLWAGSAVTYLSTSTSPDLKTCHDVWRQANMFTTPRSDDDDTDDDTDEPQDPWDRQFNHSLKNTTDISNSSAKFGSHRHTLPNHTLLRNDTYIPPQIIAEVTELTRSPPVEWSANGLNLIESGAAAAKVEVEVSTGRRADLRVSTGEVQLRTSCLRVGRTCFLTVFAPVTTYPIRLSSLDDLIHSVIECISCSGSTPPEPIEDVPITIVHGTVYLSSRYSEHHLDTTSVNLSAIPCQRVWGALQSAGNEEALEELAWALDARLDIGY